MTLALDTQLDLLTTNTHHGCFYAHVQMQRIGGRVLNLSPAAMESPASMVETGSTVELDCSDSRSEF
jgi:hypothetical protein